MACNISRASAPRHSPMTMRSGRMRKALRSKSRMLTSPWPSALLGRAWRVIRLACCNCNSALSSMVTTRSPEGMRRDSMLSNVVLPEPVPPLTTILRLCVTARRSKRAMAGDKDCLASRSSSVKAWGANLRMVKAGPFRASGGITTFRREPSAKRASTIGELSSMRLPLSASRRSMTRDSARELEKRTDVRLSTPSRSTKTVSGPLTMISVMVSSANRSSRTPRPTASCTNWRSICSRSMSALKDCRATISRMQPCASTRSCSSAMPEMSLRRRSRLEISWACTELRKSALTFITAPAAGCLRARDGA